MRIRVLHVVTAMGRGGLEVWLMNVLRNIDRSRYQLDFLVQSAEPALFDAEIVALGSKIIRCPRGRSLLSFSRALLEALRREGPYDIVHTHLHHFSGVVALLCRFAGVKRVIAHSHSVAYSDRSRLSLVKRGYLWATEQLIRRFADLGLGCSQAACDDLFPQAWRDRGRQSVLLCGIDLAPFEAAICALGSPASGSARPRTVIHVGRFNEPKNHIFLIEVLGELAVAREDFDVLLVGTGPLQAAIHERAAQLGLADRISFLGDRADVPELLARSDLFLFPSLYEGLGLALVEAQAAGVPCLISENIPSEAVVVESLVNRETLAAGPRSWASTASGKLDAQRPGRHECLRRVRSTAFDIHTCVRQLRSIYDGLLAARAAS
jgi:glycosyltransferase involved in cell wall biosynthesis